MGSSAMVGMSFDVSLRLFQVKLFSFLKKLETHLKRRLSECIADSKRRMRLGELDDRS